MLFMKLLFAFLWFAAWGFVIVLLVWDEWDWRKRQRNRRQHTP